MDLLTEQIARLGWLVSPAGPATVVAVTALILSGIPARLALAISARMPR